jgi:hypothetical protein
VLGADGLQRGGVVGRCDGRKGRSDGRFDSWLGDFEGLGHEKRV